MAIGGAHFGRGSGPIWLDDVTCRTGDEASLADCKHNGWGVENCERNSIASVRCL